MAKDRDLNVLERAAMDRIIKQSNWFTGYFTRQARKVVEGGT